MPLFDSSLSFPFVASGLLLHSQASWKDLSSFLSPRRPPDSQTHLQVHWPTDPVVPTMSDTPTVLALPPSGNTVASTAPLSPYVPSVLICSHWPFSGRRVISADAFHPLGPTRPPCPPGVGCWEISCPSFSEFWMCVSHRFHAVSSSWNPRALPKMKVSRTPPSWPSSNDACLSMDQPPSGCLQQTSQCHSG